MGITQVFADYVARMRYDALPPRVVEIGRRAFVDTVACAVAGSVEPAGRLTRELFRQDGGAPRAAVIAPRAGLRLPPAAAAMVNAVAGHALDYDDVNLMGHPSVPVVFTALAAAEDVGASGKDLLCAFAAGVEVETKLARAFGESHYLIGWHSTATLGVFGAAAAACRIYGLDADHVAIALGLAASQAAGLRQNFGTMTKPFHPGHASWAGLNAARLAGAGFTADPTALEAPLGFLAVFSAGPYEPSRAVAAMEDWGIVKPGLNVKKYPCCYCTHAAIDAALSLRQRYNIDSTQIAAIKPELSPFYLAPLIHHRPRTGLEGKFSLEYALAAALLDGKVELETFTDPMVQRPLAQALLEKVKPAAHDVPGQGLAATLARMTIELRDGTRLSEEVVQARGSGSNPLGDDELEAKFHDCARYAGAGKEWACATLDLLWNLDRAEGLGRLAELLI